MSHRRWKEGFAFWGPLFSPSSGLSLVCIPPSSPGFSTLCRTGTISAPPGAICPPSALFQTPVAVSVSPGSGRLGTVWFKSSSEPLRHRLPPRP